MATFSAIYNNTKMLIPYNEVNILNTFSVLIILRLLLLLINLHLKLLGTQDIGANKWPRQALLYLHINDQLVIVLTY